MTARLTEPHTNLLKYEVGETVLISVTNQEGEPLSCSPIQGLVMRVDVHQWICVATNHGLLTFRRSGGKQLGASDSVLRCLLGKGRGGWGPSPTAAESVLFKRKALAALHSWDPVNNDGLEELAQARADLRRCMGLD